jgi:hypothetical protein
MHRKEFLHRLGQMVSVAALSPLLVACGGGDADELGDASDGQTSLDDVAATVGFAALSVEEIAGLKFMREEEKLAHDVYSALFAYWGHQIFANIALSETEHTEAILALLLKYGVPDPAEGKPAGVFEDQDLQALYNQLVATGRQSLIDGLKVGALIEEKDIQDIVDRRALTDEAGIQGVYDSLLCGSRNHLRAFNEALLDFGVTYAAQVITQQEWDAIAYSARETCGG